MKNNCFICNIERKEFEKNDKSFENHINTEHNIWHYVYYVILIQKKKDEQKSLTGLESFVNSMYEAKSAEWFPIGTTKYISKLKNHKKFQKLTLFEEEEKKEESEMEIQIREMHSLMTQHKEVYKKIGYFLVERNKKKRGNRSYEVVSNDGYSEIPEANSESEGSLKTVQNQEEE